MAPRPKHPPPDRRREILDAALRVFARRGYAAATNAEIAREAGVTAAALYYYFPSKQDLFRAAIGQRQEDVLPALQQVAEQMKEVPPEVVLPFLIRTAFTFLEDERTRALIKIVLAEGPRDPEIAAVFQERVFGVVMPVLLGYLSHQMEKGNLRQADARALVLSIMGPLFTTVLMRDLLKVPLLQDLTNEAVIEQFVKAALHGYSAPHSNRE